MHCRLLLLGSLLAATLPAAEQTPDSFVELFDGASLDGWDGDPAYWRVEHGCLVGEVTPETLLKRNSFLIWRGGEIGDGELLVEYRVSAHGNSGVNYRSVETPGLRWSLTGYQADIEGGDRWTGQNYEERGRTFLAYRGEQVRVIPEGKPAVTARLGDRAELQKSVKKEDWNTLRISLQGNRLRHYVNGVLMSEVTDDDPARRRLAGLLGVQVHVGPPMKIEFRRIALMAPHRERMRMK
jgi:hypothetical protein